MIDITQYLLEEFSSNELQVSFGLPNNPDRKVTIGTPLDCFLADTEHLFDTSAMRKKAEMIYEIIRENNLPYATEESDRRIRQILDMKM